MSKADERALERFPVHKGASKEWIESHLKGICSDYIEGYHQAEKDLALTIDDIERIHTFLYAIKHNKQGVFTFTRLSDEQYQEVLNRFKNLKK